MKKIYTPIILAVIISSTAFAKPEKDAKVQLTNVNEQIIALRKENMNLPEIKNLRSEMRDASDAYTKAVEQIPSIKKIDSKIKTLRKEMVELQRQKMELIKSNDSALGNARKRRDDASLALRNNMMGGTRGTALQAEQVRLMKKAARSKSDKLELQK